MRAWWILCLLLAVSPLVAQSSAGSNPSAPPTTASSSNVPAGEPYQDGEFPQWATDIQRAEILTLGTFPFAVLLSGIVYDYYYWNTKDPTLKPWPLGTGTSTWTSTTQPTLLNEKNTTLIVAGVSISLGVALLDFVLGEIERDQKRRQAEKQAAELAPVEPLADPQPAPTGPADAKQP